MLRIVQDSEFINLMRYHIKEVIELLLEKEEYFSILTNITNINFDPKLPPHIEESFKPITLFVVAEYTFESCSIDDENLYFEAGFGSENIGSFVTIPLGSIVQIIIDETPILINMSMEQKKTDKSKGVEKSTNIFLSNPKNKKILKK